MLFYYHHITRLLISVVFVIRFLLPLRCSLLHHVALLLNVTLLSCCSIAGHGVLHYHAVPLLQCFCPLPSCCSHYRMLSPLLSYVGAHYFIIVAPLLAGGSSGHRSIITARSIVTSFPLTSSCCSINYHAVYSSRHVVHYRCSAFYHHIVFITSCCSINCSPFLRHRSCCSLS
jgi:hypothetical protein